MRITIQIALLFILAALSFAKGGRPEKAVATVMVSMFLLDFPNHALLGYGSYSSVNIGHLVTETAAMIALVMIALKVDRFWTLWVASAQLISVVSHVLRLMAVDMNPFIYAVMSRWPFVVMLMLLAYGTLSHALRRSRAQKTSTS